MENNYFNSPLFGFRFYTNTSDYQRWEIKQHLAELQEQILKEREMQQMMMGGMGGGPEVTNPTPNPQARTSVTAGLNPNPKPQMEPDLNEPVEVD